MENFFLRLLLLGPFASIVLVIAAAALGAFAASHFFPVRRSFRRVTYFWTTSIIFLMFTVLQLGSAFLSSTVDSGLFAPLCIFLALTISVFGAFSYYACAARSNHIAGDTSLAWLGFIPVANLWLLFKPGRADKNYVWLEDGVRDCFSLAAALIPIWFANEISDEMSKTAFQGRLLYAFEENARTVEATAYYRALYYEKRRMPYKFNGFVFRDAEADGNVLRLYYAAPSYTIGQIDSDDVHEQALLMCKGARERSFLDDGGRVEIQFETEVAISVGELMISEEVCTN